MFYGITPRTIGRPRYSKNAVVLVRSPFSALSGTKVRPAVVVNTPRLSQDIFIVPLTRRTSPLLTGEFVLTHWAAAGLHIPTAVKRGIYTLHETFVLKRVGQLIPTDVDRAVQSLRQGLGLESIDPIETTQKSDDTERTHSLTGRWHRQEAHHNKAHGA